MDYFVYTDGACKNNGKKNACAGIGVYFGEEDKRNLSKKVIGKQTNNVAELSAVIEAYHLIKTDLNIGKKIAIVTDSEYVLKCVGPYGEKCYNNNWKSTIKAGKNKKQIPNVELLREAYLMYKDSGVKFIHINAHTGHQDIHSLGNEGADRLAVEAINGRQYVNSRDTRVYLNVPYEKKEHAKYLGAKWEPLRKKWYSMQTNINLEELVKTY